ncbi:Alpha/beta hydrolase family protein [Anatilimnocola aggregata]|uniref:Alpha/beta hydrolase family protein n=1 Tax=Anatilimnocola aggregata TaxID=2528021 RepID=A0A517YFY5_9BACT|nr:prolyl oligopeptidase family serine peptidase [Anatilimnocola aggregata]QDU29111.1 Alpha/beta hydrolase family protein [Anatilimnocola aggregata]
MSAVIRDVLSNAAWISSRARWLAAAFGLLTVTVAAAGWWSLSMPLPNEERFIEMLIQGHRRQVHYDVFLPDEKHRVAARHPAIILLHGVEGAERYERSYHQTARRLNREGYAVFYVHYFDTVAYDDLWLCDDQKCLDTKAIGKFCAADSANWTEGVVAVIADIGDREDIDHDAIAIQGFSLGGYLALAATSSQVESMTLPEIAAVVVHWGAMFEDTRLERGFPATLFVHGECDSVVPMKDARATFDLLRRVECDAEFVVVPGGGHTASSADSLARTKDFLDRHLQAKRRMAKQISLEPAWNGLTFSDRDFWGMAR